MKSLIILYSKLHLSLAAVALAAGLAAACLSAGCDKPSLKEEKEVRELDRRQQYQLEIEERRLKALAEQRLLKHRYAEQLKMLHQKYGVD